MATQFGVTQFRATQFRATQFSATTPYESLATCDFFFGIGNQWAKMERIVFAFTKAFGQCITIEQVVIWLQKIIVSVASIIRFLMLIIS
jgi:hypothetical protein